MSLASHLSHNPAHRVMPMGRRAGPLEIGDDVAVAGPDTRFIEGVVNEGVIAGTTGHGVVTVATDENVVSTSAEEAVAPRRP